MKRCFVDGRPSAADSGGGLSIAWIRLSVVGAECSGGNSSCSCLGSGQTGLRRLPLKSHRSAPSAAKNTVAISVAGCGATPWCSEVVGADGRWGVRRNFDDFRAVCPSGRARPAGQGRNNLSVSCHSLIVTWSEQVRCGAQPRIAKQAWGRGDYADVVGHNNVLTVHRHKSDHVRCKLLLLLRSLGHWEPGRRGA